MSYARWGNGSDVYVFKNTSGSLECCDCELPEALPHHRFYARSTAEMVEHLNKHLAADEHVPADTIPRLWADDAENFPPAQRVSW